MHKNNKCLLAILTLCLSSLSLISCETNHSYSSYWSSDQEEHWHQCSNKSCGSRIDISPHTVSDWIITKEPTCESKGEHYKECTVCHYILTREDIAPLDHNYGESSYVWSDDYSSCTGTVICLNDNKEFSETVTPKGTVSQTQTCLLPEITTYVATFTNKGLKTQIKNVETKPMKGHDFGEVTYSWSSDYRTCTASHTCKTDSAHIESETVHSVQTVTQNVSCTLDEISSFTATFINSSFATQSVSNVVTDEAYGHDYGDVIYTWNDDYTTCTAKMICNNDSSHIISEISNDVSSQVIQTKDCTHDQITKYTAHFTNDEFDTTSSEVITEVAPGHSFVNGKCSVCDTYAFYIGEDGYTDIPSALEAASDIDYDELVIDCTGNFTGDGFNIGYFEDDNEFSWDVTINLNGFTYTLNDEVEGSSVLSNLGIYVSPNSSLNLCNGKVNNSSSEGATTLLENHGDLVLDNFTLDSSMSIDNYGTNVLLNKGTTNITNKSSLIGKISDGCNTIKLDYSGTASEDNKCSVVIEEDTGIINGNITYLNSDTEPSTGWEEYCILTIEGGIFQNYSINDNGSNSSISISGGKYDSHPPTQYIDDVMNEIDEITFEGKTYYEVVPLDIQ